MIIFDFLCWCSDCQIFEIAHSKARMAGRAEGGLPFPSAVFFTIGRYSEECTLLNTQRRKNTILTKNVDNFCKLCYKLSIRRQK